MPDYNAQTPQKTTMERKHNGEIQYLADTGADTLAFDASEKNTVAYGLRTSERLNSHSSDECGLPAKISIILAHRSRC